MCVTLHEEFHAARAASEVPYAVRFRIEEQPLAYLRRLGPAADPAFAISAGSGRVTVRAGWVGFLGSPAAVLSRFAQALREARPPAAAAHRMPSS